MGQIKIKSAYRKPHKGTMTRQIILLLMRPQGATSKDMMEVGIRKNNSISTVLRTITDDCGFDVQITGKSDGLYKYKIYRIIGKYSWLGKYRSFL